MYYLYKKSQNHTIMKYAFIIGSNAFVVPSKVIAYTDNGMDKEFLKINSIHHDQGGAAPETSLNCDIHITDLDGTPVEMIDNRITTGPSYSVSAENTGVKILRHDGTQVIFVHQLDEDAAMSLEHNITAELEVNMPVTAIRIFGDFKLGELNISAENEKLFVNDDGWGNSVKAGENQLKFTEAGVVL
jgi:hypothetical protein